MKRIPFHFFCLFLILAGCQEKILHDIDELTANQATVLLVQKGIDVSKEREGGGWSIAVARARRAEALATLEESRLLKRDLQRFPKQSKSLLRSREERSYFLERQIAYQLEQTLERIPSVLEARVHLFFQPLQVVDSFEGKQKQSASVLLVVSEAPKITEEKIQQIVTGASGVSKNDISIIFATRESTFAKRTEGGTQEEREGWEKEGMYLSPPSPGLIVCGSVVFFFTLFLLRRHSFHQTSPSLENNPETGEGAVPGEEKGKEEVF